MKKISNLELLEKCIQDQVIEYLEIKRVFHYRQNSGAFRTKGGGFVRCVSVTGAPDIVAVINGRYTGIEVKNKFGAQSDNQKEFEGRLKTAGGDYWIVRCLDELIEKLNKK